MVTLSEHRLQNGLRVIIVRRTGVHSLYLTHVFAGGSVDESPKENGLTHLLEHMIGGGTERYPTTTGLNRAIEAVGGYTNALTDVDEMQVYLSCHPSTMPQSVRILEEMVFRPRMTTQHLVREKAAVLEELLGRKDDPEAVFSDFVSKTLFAGRPEAMPTGGDPAAVRAMTLAQVRRRYEEVCRSDQQVFVAAGDVDEEALLRELRAQTEGVRLRKERPRLQPAVPSTPRFGHLVLPVQQTHLKLYFHVPFSYLDPQWSELRILTSILSKRLYRTLRERHALVYGVNASFWSQQRQGFAAIGCKFDPAKRNAVLRDIASEVRRIRTQPVSSVELRNTVRNARFSLDYAKDDIAEIAEMYATQRNDDPSGQLMTPELRQRYYDEATAGGLLQLARRTFRPAVTSCITMDASPVAPRGIARAVFG